VQQRGVPGVAAGASSSAPAKPDGARATNRTEAAPAVQQRGFPDIAAGVNSSAPAKPDVARATTRTEAARAVCAAQPQMSTAKMPPPKDRYQVREPFQTCLQGSDRAASTALCSSLYRLCGRFGLGADVSSSAPRSPSTPAPQEAAQRLAATSFVLYLVGDSTFRNQFILLCDIMGSRIKGDPARPSPEAPASCEGSLDGMRFVVGYAWATYWDPEAAHVMARSLPRPFCVYVGAALWMLWPQPFTTAFHAWPGFRAWLDYERLAMQAFTRYADLVPLIVVTTSHSICEPAWFMKQFGGLDVRPCAKGLVSKGCASSEQEGRELCASGQVNHRGAKGLAERLRSSVAAWTANRTLATVGSGGDTMRNGSSPTAVVFDAFSLTDGRCDMNLKADAKHFVKLVPEELMAFFDVLGLGVDSRNRSFTCKPVPT